MKMEKGGYKQGYSAFGEILKRSEVGTGNEENREMDKGKGGMVEVKERENKKKERKGNRKG